MLELLIMPSNATSNPEKIWRWLANIWMVLTCGVVVLDFFSFGRYSFLLPPLTILYISILSVYVTSKEFQRWFLSYKGRHPGEIGIGLWTVLIIVMLGINAYLGEKYQVSEQVISTYLTVLGIFAISKGSKAIWQRRRSR